jgi:hypothetical protein
MSFQVEKRQIDQFRADRMLLPYDDITVCRKMGVDRSNYSKAINKGPITHAFLRKFYAAYQQELMNIKSKLKADDAESNESQGSYISRRFEALTNQVEQLLEGEKKLRSEIDSCIKAVDKTIETISKIESLVTQLAMSKAPGII